MEPTKATSDECPACRAALGSGARFCAQCGTAVRNVDLGADPLIGKVIAGYRVRALIGEGGMGKVYRAEHERLKHAVCVKTLLPHFANDAKTVQRFEREGLAMAGMRHPNIVAILDFGKSDDGTLYIIMEYVEGRTLRTVLREDAPVAIERALGLTMQILSGLDEAHAQGVIHRDLKPGNVLIGRLRDGSELVKIVDFGIAKIAVGESNERGLTMTGQVVGTPGYMAPEQLVGEPVSPATDLYSTGIILWELLTGQRLFSAKSELETLNRQLFQVVPSPSTVSSLPIPQALDELCLRALERQAVRRFPSALEFRRSLELLAPSVRGGLTSPPLAGDLAAAPGEPSSPEPGRRSPTTGQSKAGDAVSRLVPSQLTSYARSLATELARAEKRTLHAFFVEVEANPGGQHEAPEVRGALGQLFEALIQAISSSGGVAERFMGSGLVAFFGLREAHEDDALRCVRAARDARAAVIEHGRQLSMPLAARVGVCGATVTGVQPDALLHESPGVSEVLNLARHVESAAGPGEILLTRFVRGAVQEAVSTTEVPAPPGHGEPLYLLGADAREDPSKVDVLAGRARESAMLTSFLDRLVQHHSGGALLLGKPGIGKSRLLRVAAQLGHQRGLTLAWARGDRLGQAPPLDLIRQLLQSMRRSDEGGAEEVSRTTLNSLAKLGLEATDVTRIQGLFSATQIDLTSNPTKEEERFHDRAALLEVFARASAQRPLLLLVDDAHLADRLSLDLLSEVVARANASNPLGLLAAARSGETDALVPRLKRVEVSALSPAEVAELINAQLRRGRAPAGLVESIWARCEGNPLYCRELVAMLLEGRDLKWTNGAWRFEATEAVLPETLAHVLAARLERVNAHARTLLRVGAVIGRAFHLDLVTASLETPIDLSQAVNECLARGLLERTEQTKGTLQFSQPLLRETILTRLVPADRRRIHQLIGEALERGVSAGAEHPLDAMSRHFVGSEQPRKAMKYLKQAADRWLAKHAFDVAARQYREAHALLTREAARLGPLSDVTAGNLLELAGLTAGALGVEDPTRALAFLDEAIAAVPEKGLGHSRTEALRQRAQLVMRLSRPAEAVKNLREALEMVEASNSDDFAHVAALRTDLAAALEAMGQLAAATSELLQVLQLLSARATPTSIALWPCLNQLGRVHLRLGKVAEAGSFFESALASAEQCASVLGQSRVVANQMVLAAQAGDQALTAALYQRALELAREGGDRLGAIRVQFNHANWLRSNGRATEADTELREVASRSRDLGWKEGEAMAAAARPGAPTSAKGAP